MSDVDEEHFAEIDDEVLIAIVQANPCLYAKNEASYKNNKLKEMKWGTIAETLNCTSSEAKKRWDSLRNQFSRKLRQQKNQPSGSGALSEWPLMSSMSFLMSHIQNRKTRGSLLQKSSSSRCETSSNSSAVSSPCAVNATELQYAVSDTNVGYSDWNADLNASLDVEYLSTSAENTMESELVSTKEKENIGSTPETPKTHAKRILVPPMDNFAKKKKTTNERLENLLCKSSQAINNLASVYKNGKVEEKKECSDPNAAVITQALKSVAPENQISCLIAVLQLIESFNR